MGFWNFLFDGRKAAADTTEATAAPVTAPAQGTQIAFNSQLVPKLQQDHQRLLALFGEIARVFQANDLSATSARLEDFRGAVLDHLMTENIRFYIYLEHSLRQDVESFELMRGFRHEMDAIGKAVLAFLSKYKDIGTQANLAASFGGDLQQVGDVLVNRIQREEETLYPLYLPAY